MTLKIPPVVQVVIVAVAMWLTALLLPSATISFSPIKWLGGFLCVAGVASALCGVFAFKKANTTVDPRSPNKTTSLVIQGIYKYSRNPMYLGFLFFLIGLSFILGNFASVVLLPMFVLFMNRYQIMPEENFMQEKFGAEFELYKRRVRRWI